MKLIRTFLVVVVVVVVALCLPPVSDAARDVSVRHLSSSHDHLYDDKDDEKTLLDIFGEVAKEYLTQRVIPETDETCQWDWRYARCEPACSCWMDYKFGDFHLGRSCRKRNESSPSSSSSSSPPPKCDEPPSTPYAKLFEMTVSHGRQITSQVKTSVVLAAIEGKNRLKQAKDNACQDIPTCDKAESSTYQRTWKQKLVCGHVPVCEDVPLPEHLKTALTGGDWFWQ